MHNMTVLYTPPPPKKKKKKKKKKVIQNYRVSLVFIRNEGKIDTALIVILSKKKSSE